TPRGANGLPGWPVLLALTDREEVLEQEPNDSPAAANLIPIPGGVTGRLQKKGDIDCYRFTGKKGQRLLIDVQTQEWHSPTLTYLVLRDPKGPELAKSNPQAAPPLDQRLDYTPSADGDYVVEVQHLFGQGGPAESYHMSVAPYQAGFGLALA